MRLADSLKRARLEAGLSLRQAGKLLGISHNSVNDWEVGKTSPDPQRYDEIATAYRITVEELFKDTDNVHYMAARNEIERATLLTLRSLPEELRRLVPGVLRGLKQSA